MAKSSLHFKLPKSVKTQAASILDKQQRRIYIRMMVDAELTQIASKNRKFSDPATALKGSKETLKVN